jgi:hypothetical protein
MSESGWLVGRSKSVRGGDKPQRLRRALSDIYLADYEVWLKNRDPRFRLRRYTDETHTFHLSG